MQSCFVCGPVSCQQDSQFNVLTTAPEALAFLRVLIAVELVFSMCYRDFLYPTLAWLGYTYGSFNHAKGESLRPRTSQAGPLERHMWRVIELSIMNWQASLFMFHGRYVGWDWLWACVAVHATTGLVWELKSHEGVEAARRDDLETGGAAAVEPGVAVSSPTSGSGPQNEAGSEFPEHHQSSVIEDIDTVGEQEPSNNSTATRTPFSVYGERGPRWFSVISILLWALSAETVLRNSLHLYWPNVVALAVLLGSGVVLAILLIWTRSHTWNRRVSMLWVAWFIVWLITPAMSPVHF